MPAPCHLGGMPAQSCTQKIYGKWTFLVSDGVLCASNQQAKAAMTTFNTLIDRVAADEGYLFDTLELAGQQDDFTGRLLQLLQDSKPARAAAAAAGAKEVVLGVHRSDFMLDAPSGGFLQVRFPASTAVVAAVECCHF